MGDGDAQTAGDGDDAADDHVDDAADEHADDAADDHVDGAGDEPADGKEPDVRSLSTEELREQVEERYDFDEFGPEDMAEMDVEEWEAAFDPETWITGEELLDRVEADLKARVLDRDVFARVERFGDVVVAYDERSYAAVYPDGSVRGRGTVLRDVEPTVALCSMDSYDPPDVPEGPILPEPREIPESSDTLGNSVLQLLGVVMLVAGGVLLGGYVLHLLGVLSIEAAAETGVNLVLLVVAGAGFVLAGLFLLVVVANARLSDRFRSEAYRERLRSVGLADGERPDFLGEIEGVQLPASTEGKGSSERD